MRLTILCAVGLLGLSAPAAIASPCGGGSSGGGSGGSSSGGSSSGGSYSSSSSDDDDSSSSSSSTTPSCDSGNGIVGRNQCNKFGHWDRRAMTRLRMGLSLVGGSASIDDMGFHGEAEHEEVHKYHYPTGSSPDAGSSQMGSLGLEMSAASMIGDYLLLGAFGSMEGGSSNAPDRTIDGLRVRPTSLVQFKTGAQVGVSVPVGKWLLRGDALVGLRATGMSFESQIGDCITQSMAWNHELMVEPRVGIERWLTPWLTAGVMVGSDALSDRDLNVSIGITGHTSAYDSRGAVALPP